MFASAAGAVSGIAALQALAPPPVRGLAMSMIAFCNTLLGLGLGPSIISVPGEQMAGPAAPSAALSIGIPIGAGLPVVSPKLTPTTGRRRPVGPLPSRYDFYIYQFPSHQASAYTAPILGV